jgi:hypothetical protein
MQVWQLLVNPRNWQTFGRIGLQHGTLDTLFFATLGIQDELPHRRAKSTFHVVTTVRPADRTCIGKSYAPYAAHRAQTVFRPFWCGWTITALGSPYEVQQPT